MAPLAKAFTPPLPVIHENFGELRFTHEAVKHRPTNSVYVFKSNLLRHFTADYTL